MNLAWFSRLSAIMLHFPSMGPMVWNFIMCRRVQKDVKKERIRILRQNFFFCLGDPPRVCWVVAGIFTIITITQRAQVRMISGAFTPFALFQNRQSVLGQPECFLWLILCSHSLLQAGCALHCDNDNNNEMSHTH